MLRARAESGPSGAWKLVYRQHEEGPCSGSRAKGFAASNYEGQRWGFSAPNKRSVDRSSSSRRCFLAVEAFCTLRPGPLRWIFKWTAEISPSLDRVGVSERNAQMHPEKCTRPSQPSLSSASPLPLPLHPSTRAPWHPLTHPPTPTSRRRICTLPKGISCPSCLAGV